MIIVQGEKYQKQRLFRCSNLNFYSFLNFKFLVEKRFQIIVDKVLRIPAVLENVH